MYVSIKPNGSCRVIIADSEKMMQIEARYAGGGHTQEVNDEGLSKTFMLAIELRISVEKFSSSTSATHQQRADGEIGMHHDMQMASQVPIEAFAPPAMMIAVVDEDIEIEGEIF
jgi:hypothetical protein